MMRERVQLIAVLGGKCVQCGIDDIEMLQLDHIHDDGLQDMARFGSNLLMYQYYLNQLDEARRTFQVLCANHNWKKRYAKNKKKVGKPKGLADRVRCLSCGEFVYREVVDGYWAGKCTNCRKDSIEKYEPSTTLRKCPSCGYKCYITIQNRNCTNCEREMKTDCDTTCNTT